MKRTDTGIAAHQQLPIHDSLREALAMSSVHLERLVNISEFLGINGADKPYQMPPATGMSLTAQSLLLNVSEISMHLTRIESALGVAPKPSNNAEKFR